MTDKNANRELGKIERTMLGREDHGIFSFWITINFGGTAQGFGGYVLKGTFTDDVILGILDAVGVENWEDLKGKSVWIRRNDGKTGYHALGSFSSKIVSIEAPDFVKHSGEFNIEVACEKFQKSPEYKLLVAEKKGK